MERKMCFAGTWYPDNREELEAITSCSQDDGRKARFAVLPHAGLFYSAPFISQFFSSLDSEIRRVLIISPSHYKRLAQDRPVVSQFSTAQTPLGPVNVFSLPMKAAIVDNDAVAMEHGVEMFLPFVAACGLDVSFMMFGSFTSFRELAFTARDIIEAIDTETAIIASSDFTHYGPRFGYIPYLGKDEHKLVAQHDLKIANALARSQARALYCQRKINTICGFDEAMLVSEIAADIGMPGWVAGQGTSDDLTGTRNSDFVSYMSIFWGLDNA